MPAAYEIVDLVERSPAWWQWRRGGVGSSDAAGILGEKRAKSAERLLLEKLHPPDSSARSFAQARGAAMERTARAQYCLALAGKFHPFLRGNMTECPKIWSAGEPLHPFPAEKCGLEFRMDPTCVQSTARPWQRASLDGLSADGQRVVEIKCGLAALQSATARRRPPRHHYAQLQHILSVTGLPVIDYWCYVPSHPPLRLEVRRDESYIDRLVAAEDAFWRRCAGHG